MAHLTEDMRMIGEGGRDDSAADDDEVYSGALQREETMILMDDPKALASWSNSVDYYRRKPPDKLRDEINTDLAGVKRDSVQMIRRYERLGKKLEAYRLNYTGEGIEKAYMRDFGLIPQRVSNYVRISQHADALVAHVERTGGSLGINACIALINAPARPNPRVTFADLEDKHLPSGGPERRKPTPSHERDLIAMAKAFVGECEAQTHNARTREALGIIARYADSVLNPPTDADDDDTQS